MLFVLDGGTCWRTPLSVGFGGFLAKMRLTIVEIAKFTTIAAAYAKVMEMVKPVAWAKKKPIEMGSTANAGNAISRPKKNTNNFFIK